jgi:hypothetical protein
MKVTLIDYTGAGSTDEWYAAKKLIRAKNTRVHTPMDLDAMDEDALRTEFGGYKIKVEWIETALGPAIWRNT